MAKFHIGKKGEPTVCRAKNGNCPFGGEEQHYSTKQEAQQAIEKSLENQHKTINSIQKTNTVSLSSDELINKLYDNISNVLMDSYYYNKYDTSDAKPGNFSKKQWKDINASFEHMYENIDSFSSDKQYWLEFRDNIEKEMFSIYTVKIDKYKQENPDFEESFDMNTIFDRGRQEERLQKRMNAQIENLQIAKNISTKSTYLQQNFNITPLKTMSTWETASMFRAGMVPLDGETNKTALEAYQNDKKALGYIETLKQSRHPEIDAEINDIEMSETEQAFDNDKDYVEFGNGKTATTKEIVRDYTSQYYRYFAAQSLGHNRKIDRPMVNDIEDTHVDFLNKKIIELSRAPEKRMVYRGQRSPDGMSAQQYADMFEVGSVVTTSKMTSTTIEQYTATSFGSVESENRQGTENIQFSYYTKKGLYVEPITTIYGEEEVVLPIGEKYVVTEKFRDEKGTMNIVFVDNE